MERSEPKLAPEWLKSNGNKASGSSSSLPLGNSETSRFTRSKSSSVSGTDYPSSRRSLNKSSSDHSRSYSNFGRNGHYKDRYRDRYDSSVHDMPKKSSGVRTQKDGLRISERNSETWMRSPRGGEKNNLGYSNGLPDKHSLFNSLHKSDLEGSSALHSSGIGKTRSPIVTTATQSTPRPSSGIKNGDKWTSSLAEVPPTTGSDGSSFSSVQLASTLSTAAAGFSMAEAVAKSPRTVQSTSELPNGNQRLEDLAIKQSRILIPVTPSAPKTSALNPSDKTKSKVTEQRQQQHPMSSSHVASHSARNGPSVTSDALKTSSFGKLQVLKPTREKNGVSSVVNNCSDPSPDTKAIKPVLSPSAVLQRPTQIPVSTKPARRTTEKKLSSQAKSRNDFFNLMRKKSTGESCAASETAAPEASIAPATQGQDTQSSDSPSVNVPVENTKEETVEDDKEQLKNGKTHPGPDALLSSEEEEAAFLRSLGWEENADEGGLTEEEISTFYRDVTKYINSKLPLKIMQSIQPRLMLLTLNS